MQTLKEKYSQHNPNYSWNPGLDEAIYMYMSMESDRLAAWCLISISKNKLDANIFKEISESSVQCVLLPVCSFSLSSFPAPCTYVHPVLRLFSDSSRGPALSRCEDQETGGSQSLALFRVTAGVIRLLMHVVAAPFERRERWDSFFALHVGVCDY